MNPHAQDMVRIFEVILGVSITLALGVMGLIIFLTGLSWWWLLATPLLMVVFIILILIYLRFAVGFPN